MSDLVTCGQCGTRYDSDQNAFCPRCGSTAKGAVLPAAVAVAQRHDPARRRVQASGALLLLVGALFLVSSLVGLAVPLGQVAGQFTEPMADQPGGTLVLVPPDAAPYDATVTTWDGEPVANATAHSGELTVKSPDHATLRVAWTANGTTHNATAIVLGGDTLRLDLSASAEDGVHVSSTLRKTVSVGRVVFIAAAALLLAGGLCAVLLRLWPLAVAAAVLGVLLAAVVLVGFLVAGLLFAVPFGFAAYFILRGRRHFHRAAPKA